MGYETAGWIPLRYLKEIPDKDFQKCLHHALNDGLSVNLMSLISELQYNGCLDKYLDTVARIHGKDVSRPEEVKEEYKKILQTLARYL